MNKIDLTGFLARLRRADTQFDLHQFDTDLAQALGIETPNDYAQRKAEEEGLAIPPSALDAYSMGRKLVALVGEGWTWSITDNAGEAEAAVWLPGSEFKRQAQGTGPVALRLAALDALSRGAL